jgi:hypothetical protein
LNGSADYGTANRIKEKDFELVLYIKPEWVMDNNNNHLVTRIPDPITRGILG